MSALPEYPARPVKFLDEREPYKTNTILRHVMDERDAALARLRVASNCGYLQHLDWCDLPQDLTCVCGLDELLADLLPLGAGR